MPKREVDAKTRARIAEHVRWWMALHACNQAAVVEKTGLHNSTVSRIVKERFRSLGLDVFLALHRGLDIDAQTMLEYDPLWERVPRERRPIRMNLGVAQANGPG